MTITDLRQRYKDLESTVKYAESIVQAAKDAAKLAQLNVQSAEDALWRARFDLRVCEDHFFLQAQHEEALEAKTADAEALLEQGRFDEANAKLEDAKIIEENSK